ncbi:MAG TPA: (E)-4-hydroxy-3-methylbut-2-enyl-diphosphate synthase [Bacteroidales bacterium]|nr:(E)-4-hydroxy-3-methylbut-2-enyl-diphosphate synthase [Bacteroidales bacterium]HPI30969.1 (E)-4-hydroxy-3-methylbut-2-enyl-diphosphate synthase [Bacteroidales bacterium]
MFFIKSKLVLSRELHIGNLLLGGKNPVRVQSMTNTNTMDTAATVSQTLQLATAGCDLVRITARNVAEAENLRKIKQALAEKNCFVPLVADIHFQPRAAEVAARIVEKVRINPGNYVDKISSGAKKIIYSENQYVKELEDISNRLKPLLGICREYGTAIRIGVNHGSLSERVVSRYGDTVEGMVVSAMEYIDICRYHGFHNLVLSMKSSDVKTMIYAYRQLVLRMTESGYDYPLHLGVTEAGAGKDARIKSGAGIGLLLMEGIGDTIRVSLTENPVHEVPVALSLVKAFSAAKKNSAPSPKRAYEKQETINIGTIGGEQQPVCIFAGIEAKSCKEPMPDFYWNKDGQCLTSPDNQQTVGLVYVDSKDLDDTGFLKKSCGEIPRVLFFDIGSTGDLPALREKLTAWRQRGNNWPLILYKKYFVNTEEMVTLAPAEMACFLADGAGDGICIDSDDDACELTSLMFGILQTMGLRRTRAEFIACPTCGRTSYNVEGTLELITRELSHLKHLKIGVMGCVVNGPGEMADADYGYVGASAGKINLYRKKQVVLKNIDESEALEALIRLIREDGKWTEPLLPDK